MSVVLLFFSCSETSRRSNNDKNIVLENLVKAKNLLSDHPDSAYFYAQAAYQKAVKGNLEALKQEAGLVKGKSLMYQEKYKQALVCFKAVVITPADKKNGNFIGEAYYQMGLIEEQSQNYLSAIINFRKVLNLKDLQVSPRISGLAAEGLGDIYAEMNYTDNAYKYYRIGQHYQKEAHDAGKYFTILNKVGTVYAQEHHLSKAIDVYQKTLEFFRKKGDKSQEAATELKIAETYFLQDSIAAAIKAGEAAKDIALENSDLELLAPAYLVLGKGYYRNKQFIKAKENLEESQQIADILNDDGIKSEGYQYLAFVFENLNNFEKSIDYFKAYNASLNKMKEEYASQRSKDILTDIMLNKKQKEIASLQRKNQVVEKYSSLRSEGLGSNRGFIILLTAFVILFILLVALYYKRFRDKKVMSIALEDRVTERTNELNLALRKLSFHINNTSLAVIELDPDFGIKGWSGQSERVFGWSGTEVEGRELLSINIFDVKTIKEIKAVFNKIKKGNLSKKFMMTKSYHKDGSELFIEWNFSALYNESEEIISLLCFANNVTPREKALLEAETANRELDNFIYKTSHDVKAIARIEGIINLGMLEAQEEVSKNYFTMLRQVAANFNIVLSRLFRIHGIYYHKPVPVDLKLKHEIRYLLEKLQKKNSSHSLKYEIEIPEEAEWSTDKLLFYIIIQNIYENALDYRIDGLSTITISTDTSNPKVLKLHIRDNGTCIPLEAADRIFDMFFQNTAQSNTAGLGLYMVKKSVEKLGGSIKLVGEKKETFFEITLPAASTLTI